MVFSNLMNWRSLYETEVMQLRIEPELQMPAYRKSHIFRSFDRRHLLRRRRKYVCPSSVCWGWSQRCQQLGKILSTSGRNGAAACFQLAKMKKFFSGREYYRRAAHAVDSKTTKFGDSFATSATKLKNLVKSSMKRLRMPEPSWDHFDDIFSGGNMSLIPFPMHLMFRI